MKILGWLISWNVYARQAVPEVGLPLIEILPPLQHLSLLVTEGMRGVEDREERREASGGGVEGRPGMTNRSYGAGWETAMVAIRTARGLRTVRARAARGREA